MLTMRAFAGGGVRVLCACARVAVVAAARFLFFSASLFFFPHAEDLCGAAWAGVIFGVRVVALVRGERDQRARRHGPAPGNVYARVHMDRIQHRKGAEALSRCLLWCFRCVWMG